jgi:hypothetical protein
MCCYPLHPHQWKLELNFKQNDATTSPEKERFNYSIPFSFTGEGLGMRSERVTASSIFKR